MKKGDIIIIYSKPIPKYEAMYNGDGTFTLSEVINNSNQVKVVNCIINDREYFFIKNIL